MKRRIRAAWVGAFLCFAVGCADDPASAVRAGGNVASVSGKPATAKAETPAANRLTAFREWMRSPWTIAALAQSSCGAAVEGVLACLATQSATGDFRAACSRVRSNCEFEVELGLAADGDELVLFFCADVNGDAVCDPSEPAAPYLDFGKVDSFCNGDVLTVTDVSVDFASETCSGPPSSVVADGCGAPEPTSPAPQATTTARPDSTPRPGETPLPTQTSAPAPTGTPSPQPTFRPTPSGTPCVPHLLPCSPNGNDCCVPSDSCRNGFCGSGRCIETGQPGCGELPCCNGEDFCGGNVCLSTCGNLGEGCATRADCCSGACDGVCCIADGDSCSSETDCCGSSFCDGETFTCTPSV